MSIWCWKKKLFFDEWWELHLFVVVLVAFCCCDETLTKGNLRRKKLFGLQSTHHQRGFTAWTQGGYLQARTKAETTQEHCLLACFSLLDVFSCTTKIYLPRGSVAHRECTLSDQPLVNKMPHGHSYSQHYTATEQELKHPQISVTLTLHQSWFFL